MVAYIWWKSSFTFICVFFRHPIEKISESATIYFINKLLLNKMWNKMYELHLYILNVIARSHGDIEEFEFVNRSQKELKTKGSPHMVIYWYWRLTVTQILRSLFQFVNTFGGPRFELIDETLGWTMAQFVQIRSRSRDVNSFCLFGIKLPKWLPSLYHFDHFGLHVYFVAILVFCFVKKLSLWSFRQRSLKSLLTLGVV